MSGVCDFRGMLGGTPLDDFILDGMTKKSQSNEHVYDEKFLHDMFMIGFCCIFVAPKETVQKHGP